MSSAVPTGNLINPHKNKIEKAISKIKKSTGSTFFLQFF